MDMFCDFRLLGNSLKPKTVMDHRAVKNKFGGSEQPTS